MRAFIALDIPDAVKERILALQKKLPSVGVRPVASANMHITLKFLGDIHEDLMKCTMKKLVEISFRSFSLELTHLGAFPSSEQIRVIWVGGESTAFDALASQIEQSLAGLFPREKPVLHLTIARVGPEAQQKELHDFLSAHKTVALGSIPVHVFSLKQSILTSKCPVYTDLATYQSNDEKT
ncbi:MAG: RNA 2',3'-cyclic phosphodiesterase [Candidatus Aenigmarchaeota archaeon]|nr:RNA 2',3'-cyclic phosphodiesterase [Candidatus Aenigmarchaeota archaeon]